MFFIQKNSHFIYSCESPSLCLCRMYRSQIHWRKAKSSQRRRKLVSSVKGVSHLSRRAKRRFYCKLQLWMWRKRSEKRRLWIFRGRRRPSGIISGSGPNLSLKPQSQKNQVFTNHTRNRENSPLRASTPLPPPQQNAGGDVKLQNGLQNWSEPDSLPETLNDSSCMKTTNITSLTHSQVTQAALLSSQSSKTPVALRELTDPLRLCHSIKPLPCADSNSCSKQGAQRLEADAPSNQHCPVLPYQSQTASVCRDETISSEQTSSPTDVNFNTLSREIQDFLDGFYKRYGSFIPLCKSDMLKHLKRKFNSDFTDRKNVLFSVAARHQAATIQRAVPCFQVVYKKHILTLEDLLTLADQNWLNDQVMNMYGELIMESAYHKVHFLNSFFHRQLMTKGYDGVKRWTKQVDLFSKSLLLVPIHLEVHWCLVTADITTKKICLYDSQGHALQKVARNILKYLMTEAKEKKQPTFVDGWTVSYDEKVPQQTNENDCGVFVLEYSRCLALSRCFQFSQKDIPKIRKRIYKELCDCKLHEPD